MCDQQSLRSACAYAQSDQSLFWSLEYSMIVKLLTEHHLEFLSLKGGCRGSSESTLVKMSNCWKSHAAAQIQLTLNTLRLKVCKSFRQILSSACVVKTIWASSRENLSSGFPTKRVSNQSPQLQRLPRKLKCHL